jgi:RNA polymerase sigma-B factor
MAQRTRLLGGLVHDLDDAGRLARSGSRASRSTGSRRGRETAALFEMLTDATEAERDDVRRQIVLVNTGVALAVARRYHGRGIDGEDLDQTACLSLVLAVRTFDPLRGHDFLSFAVPTIAGGVKQHFRDQGWTIRVPRRVQEVQLLIDREGLPEADEIRYGVHTVTRLAKHLHLTTREVEAALRARGCFSPASIDQKGAWPPSRALAADGRYGTEEQDAIELRAVLAPLLDRLALRDRELLRLRFGEDQTQQAIAVELRLTQAQVSRLLTRVIAKLRADLEAAEHASDLGRVVSLAGHAP